MKAEFQPLIGNKRGIFRIKSSYYNNQSICWGIGYGIWSSYNDFNDHLRNK